MNEKIVIGAVVVLFLASLPLVVHLTKDPIPLTFERIKEIYQENNYSVGNDQNARRAGYGASSEMSMTINGAATRVFLFTETKKLDDTVAEIETDAVKGIPDWMPKNSATASRNGGYIMLVTCEDEGLRSRIIVLFEGMDNPKQPATTAPQ